MRDDLFMITCAARTGSTLLQAYIRSHPDVMMHGEVYPPRHVAALQGRYAAMMGGEDAVADITRYRDENQTAFLYKVVYDAQGYKRVGHKFKYEEMLLPQFAETREAVRRDTDIRILHIYRRNLLERFVSWWMVNHVTGVTMITDESERPEQRRVTIPFAEMERNFNEVSGRFAFVRKLLSNRPSYEVAYEDLVDEGRKDAILSEIQTFLGLDPVKLEAPLKKVTVRSMRELVENYDDLKGRFAGTPFAEFFEE